MSDDKLTQEEIDEHGWSECHACSFDFGKDAINKLTWYEMRTKTSGRSLLCFLCANSQAGSAHEYPQQFTDGSILFTICSVGNAILKAIEDSKR